MKTKRDLEKSEVCITDFLQPMDEVDEALYLYMGEIVAPQYCTYDFMQVGEADLEFQGVLFYSTFAHLNGRYYYLGTLPEFKQ